MKILIQQHVMAPKLKLAAGVTDKKSTMPILAHVMLRAKDGYLTIEATDLVCAISARVPCKVLEPGESCLVAKDLVTALEHLSGDVTIETEKNHWANVKAGRARMSIVGLYPGDFPSIHAPPATLGKVPSATLRTLIERTAFSCSTDHTRENVNGPRWEWNDGMITSTGLDGHRMTTMTVPCEGAPDLAVTVARRGVTEAMRVLDLAAEVAVGIGNGADRYGPPCVFFVADDVVLSTKTIQAEFPPWRNFLGIETKHSVTLESAPFLTLLRRAGLMATETHGMRMAFSSGTLHVSSNAPGRGESSDEMDIAYDGSEVIIGMNFKYLAEVIEAAGATFTMGFSDGLDPLVVKADGFTAVVMPQRLM